MEMTPKLLRGLKWTETSGQLSANFHIVHFLINTINGRLGPSAEAWYKFELFRDDDGGWNQVPFSIDIDIDSLYKTLCNEINPKLEELRKTTSKMFWALEQ